MLYDINACASRVFWRLSLCSSNYPDLLPGPQCFIAAGMRMPRVSVLCQALQRYLEFLVCFPYSFAVGLLPPVMPVFPEKSDCLPVEEEQRSTCMAMTRSTQHDAAPRRGSIRLPFRPSLP